MSKALSVLIVEDCEDDALLLLRCLRLAGFDPSYQRVETESAMAAALDAAPWDLVISDHNMPTFSAPHALRVLHSKGLDLPFIIVSGMIGEEAAVIAMKAGAQDYLVKGQLARLPAAIERELKDAEERRGRKSAERQIRFLAYFDPLTSLPNRTNFCEQLKHLLSVPLQAGREIAILGVKLDSLGEINNTLGYATGELVLAELGARLRRATGTSQLLARTGGAEFAIVLPDVADADAAVSAALQYQQAISGTVSIHDMEMEPATSIGIALFPRDGDEPELLLQRTNVALKQAAESWTRIALYDRAADPFQPKRLSLISELRRAIENGQLRLQYQPKVCLATRRLIGVEALVRWTHPKLGNLLPDQFIPLAEQTGLINPLTRWVLEEAMHQSHAWQGLGLHLNIAVNLSAKNLHTTELSDHLARLLSSSGLSAETLMFEVTESAVMSDESRAQDTLHRLHEQGVEIAIDDFGTGYSSFANLRRLPVSEIKIDKSFVMSMAHSSDDRIIVDSIIELGHKLGLHVVAEGVETLCAWHMLGDLRCDHAQGYYLSRPLAAVDVLAWTRGFVPPEATHPITHWPRIASASGTRQGGHARVSE